MTQKANIIELNGKRYDSVTGKMLGTNLIDDFVTVPRQTHPTNLVAHGVGVPLTPHHVAAEASSVVRRDVAHHVPAHRPQHAKTLMRGAVHRPPATLKRRTKAVMHTGLLIKQPTIDVFPKHSVDSIDEARLKRAKHIARSSFISRFGSLLSPTLSVAHASVAGTASLGHVQPMPDIAAHPSTPPPQATHHQQTSKDIFERALAHANSHNQPFVHPKHKAKRAHRIRPATIATSSLALLLLVGFIAYQNVNYIQLRIASSSAGIHASLPKWQPSGFAIGAFSSTAGSVAVDFRSTTSPQSFRLSQTASKWDSFTLFQDFVLANSNTYNAIPVDGKTIYTYGNNDATWVAGGIWYNLLTHGSLSTSQLIHIASSM